jgi:hypothetical protein
MVVALHALANVIHVKCSSKSKHLQMTTALNCLTHLLQYLSSGSGYVWFMVKILKFFRCIPKCRTRVDLQCLFFLFSKCL